MSFRNRVRRAISRGSSSLNSPTESAFQSQEISRIQTPTSRSSLTDHDKLTIDPRDNPLTLIESNTTAKRRSALYRIRSAMKKEDPFKDWPEDIYKPSELPRPKYRRPVDPEHKASLQGYSLRDAFANMRRNSGLSQYSPMGSRLPSRRNSFSSRAGRSAFSTRNHSAAALDNLSDVPSGQSIENQSRFLSMPVRRHGDAIPDESLVPGLVPSSSTDSDDTDSFCYTSEPISLGDVSRAEDAFAPELKQPFDEEELVRAFTRKLISHER